jgi:hypothetical protein
MTEDFKSAFPHHYTLKDEEMLECHLFAKHEESSAEFNIFQASSAYTKAGDKYDENYVGALEKNFWGTQFTLWDNGLPQPLLEKLPDGFGSLRKKLLGKKSVFDDSQMLNWGDRYKIQEKYLRKPTKGLGREHF